MSDKQLLGILLLILAGFFAILHSKKVLPQVGAVFLSNEFEGPNLLQLSVAVITLLVALSLLPKKSGTIVAVLVLFGGLSINQNLVDSGTLAGPSLLDSIAGKK
jgi:hypothetical protein